MNEHPKKSFSKKHGTEVHPDDAVIREITSRAKGDQLACAVAFAIADQLRVGPGTVGKNADLLNIKLFKCQLGLFGYPSGKNVAPLSEVPSELAEAVRTGLEGGYLPCKTAWAIASRFDLPKRTVSNACETLKIKIKPCQLGAF